MSIIIEWRGHHQSIEVFHSEDYPEYDGEPLAEGHYYWYVQPGCLPDSEPFGPYDTADSAYDAAMEELKEYAAQ